MKTYLEISITASEKQRENLIPTMLELGCKGFQETDTSLLCYFDKSQWNKTKYELLKKEIKQLLQTISANAIISFKEIVEENWNGQWEKTIKPIEIGDKIVIKPSWAEYENIKSKIVIQIDPKMSFGTGYHETTRLSLRLLEKYINVGNTILDVGTGTGILAIAAVMLGASSSIGIDVDEWSIENAKENIKINKVENLVQISNNLIENIKDITFDIICANLTLNTNIELINHFLRLLNNKGLLILSGMLKEDEEKITGVLNDNKLTIINKLIENEWIAIACRKEIIKKQ